MSLTPAARLIARRGTLIGLGAGALGLAGCGGIDPARYAREQPRLCLL